MSLIDQNHTLCSYQLTAKQTKPTTCLYVLVAVLELIVSYKSYSGNLVRNSQSAKPCPAKANTLARWAVDEKQLACYAICPFPRKNEADCAFAND